MTEATVVLPTRNEVLAIGKLIDEIKSLPWDLDILVVDYNSSDGTREVVLSKGIVLIDEENPGKGSAIKTALKEIGTPYMIVVNSDLTYPVEYIGLVLYILRLGYDGVMGVRFLKGKGSMSLLHSIGNYLLSLLASILYLHRITDVNTGLWGYKTEVIRKFDITSKGFTLEADIFTNAMLSNCKVMQIPIEYRARVGGSYPKLRFWDGFKIGWFLIKRRFSKCCVQE